MISRNCLLASFAFLTACATTQATSTQSSSTQAPSTQAASMDATSPATSRTSAGGACFLLHELGKGEIRRNPAAACSKRVTPVSTFKIPHALAAIDAGVIQADTVLPYDGAPVPFDSWRRDHSLQSAMHSSVVWYFQQVAELLGPSKEQEYLDKLDYGNKDCSGNPRRFWIEDSLDISPDEQLVFLLRLYRGELPVSRHSQDVVRRILVQPRGVIVNAAGEYPFAQPWPADATVSAKTGSGSYPSGLDVRWIVGHVQRQRRSWAFVSMVSESSPAELGAYSAVELAAHALREEDVL